MKHPFAWQCLIIALLAATTHADVVTIRFSGGSVPNAPIKAWVNEFEAIHGADVNFAWEAIGSGSAKAKVIAGDADFASSESPLTTEEIAEAPDLMTYPYLATALVPVVNIVNTREIVLSREMLSRVFVGDVTSWTDQRILDLQDDTNRAALLAMADPEISLCVRSGKRGTTFVLTTALNTFWPGSVTPQSTEAAWNGMPGNRVLVEGDHAQMVACVEGREGALGYAGLADVVGSELKQVALVNSYGNEVIGSAVTIAEGISDAVFDNYHITNVVDQPGRLAYPICTFSYLVMHISTYPDCVKMNWMLRWFQYVMESNDAKDSAENLGFAVLSQEVYEMVSTEMKSLRCDTVYRLEVHGGCPITNNQVCAGHGECQPVDNTCACDSSYIAPLCDLRSDSSSVSGSDVALIVLALVCAGAVVYFRERVLGLERRVWEFQEFIQMHVPSKTTTVFMGMLLEAIQLVALAADGGDDVQYTLFAAPHMPYGVFLMLYWLMVLWFFMLAPVCYRISEGVRNLDDIEQSSSKLVRLTTWSMWGLFQQQVLPLPLFALLFHTFSCSAINALDGAPACGSTVIIALRIISVPLVLAALIFTVGLVPTAFDPSLRRPLSRHHNWVGIAALLSKIVVALMHTVLYNHDKSRSVLLLVVLLVPAVVSVYTMPFHVMRWNYVQSGLYTGVVAAMLVSVARAWGDSTAMETALWPVAVCGVLLGVLVQWLWFLRCRSFENSSHPIHGELSTRHLDTVDEKIEVLRRVVSARSSSAFVRLNAVAMMLAVGENAVDLSSTLVELSNAKRLHPLLIDRYRLYCLEHMRKRALGVQLGETSREFSRAYHGTLNEHNKLTRDVIKFWKNLSSTGETKTVDSSVQENLRSIRSRQKRTTMRFLKLIRDFPTSAKAHLSYGRFLDEVMMDAVSANRHFDMATVLHEAKHGTGRRPVGSSLAAGSTTGGTSVTGTTATGASSVGPTLGVPAPGLTDGLDLEAGSTGHPSESGSDAHSMHSMSEAGSHVGFMPSVSHTGGSAYGGGGQGSVHSYHSHHSSHIRGLLASTAGGASTSMRRNLSAAEQELWRRHRARLDQIAHEQSKGVVFKSIFAAFVLVGLIVAVSIVDAQLATESKDHTDTMQHIGELGRWAVTFAVETTHAFAYAVLGESQEWQDTIPTVQNTLTSVNDLVDTVVDQVRSLPVVDDIFHESVTEEVLTTFYVDGREQVRVANVSLESVMDNLFTRSFQLASLDMNMLALAKTNTTSSTVAMRSYRYVVDNYMNVLDGLSAAMIAMEEEMVDLNDEATLVFSLLFALSIVVLFLWCILAFLPLVRKSEQHRMKVLDMLAQVPSSTVDLIVESIRASSQWGAAEKHTSSDSEGKGKGKGKEGAGTGTSDSDLTPQQQRYMDDLGDAGSRMSSVSWRRNLAILVAALTLIFIATFAVRMVMLERTKKAGLTLDYANRRAGMAMQVGLVSHMLCTDGEVDYRGRRRRDDVLQTVQALREVHEALVYSTGHIPQEAMDLDAVHKLTHSEVFTIAHQQSAEEIAEGVQPYDHIFFGLSEALRFLGDDVDHMMTELPMPAQVADRNHPKMLEVQSMVDVHQPITAGLVEVSTLFAEHFDDVFDLRLLLSYVMLAIMLVCFAILYAVLLNPIVRMMLEENETTHLLLSMVPPDRVSEVDALRSYFVTGVVKASDEAFKLSEQHTRLLMQAVAEPILLSSAGGTVQTVNHAAVQSFGYTSSEMVSRDMHELIPSLPADVCDLVGKAGRITELVGGDDEHTLIPVTVSVTDLWYGDTRTLVWLVRDMRAEQEARKTEVTQAIFENASEPIVTLGADGIVSAVNKESESSFGYERDELVGMPLSELVGDVDGHALTAVETSDCSALLARLRESEKSINIRCKSGEALPVEVSITENDFDGELMYTLIVRDVTLKHAQEKALAQSKAKSAFLANMSHEIRTPLNGILGINQVLLTSGDELADEQRHQYYRIIDNSANTLLSIISDILDLNKIEAGKLVLEEIPFDLEQVIEAAVQSMALTAQQKGLHIAAYIDAGGPCAVRGDPVRLQQCVLNILGNAIKFTEKGAVAVCATIKKNETGVATWEIAIEDSGIGLREEQIKKLFSRFSQADSSTTRKFGGSGLGLSITKQLVEMMGGSVTVQSTWGEGSTFLLSVPLTTQPEQPERFPHALVKSDTRVLVVHPHKTTLFALGSYFERFGASVVSAMSPDEIGIDGMPALEFDLIATWAAFAPEVCNRARSPGHSIVMLNNMDYVPPPPTPSASPLRPVYFALPASRSNVLQLWAETVVDAKSHEGTTLYGSTTDILSPKAGVRPRMRLQSITEEPRLPISPEQRGKVVESSSDEDGDERLTLLVAEDDSVNQTVIRLLLQKNFHVSIVDNGEEAVRELTGKHPRGHFAAVLMDHMMPVCDGFEATRRVREWEAAQSGDQHVPIIALTAGAMEQDKKDALECGMDAFLTKPVVRTQLYKTLKEFIPGLDRRLENMRVSRRRKKKSM